MPRPDLDRLLDELLRAGISPLYARRAAAELDDHFEDLLADHLANGLSRRDAERNAAQDLGSLDVVAERMRADPGLRSWAWRWPKLALVVYPIACVAALPAVPFIAGVAHKDSVARWTAGLLLAGLFTAGLLLMLQLALTGAASGLPG